MTKGSRIVGGENAPSPIPWQVKVHISNQPICGGTILNEETILSAAHCFHPLSQAHDQDFIEAGMIKLFSKDRERFMGQKKFIKQIILHPNYNTSTKNNDIAILKLKTPLSFSEAVQPASLPDHSFRPETEGKLGIVSGWGRTSNGNVSNIQGPPLQFFILQLVLTVGNMYFYNN